MRKLEIIDGKIGLAKWSYFIKSWELLEDGFLSICEDNTILIKTMNDLKKENLNLFYFDAKDWNTLDDFYFQFSSKMNFPSYFGNNLDAINDCLSDFTGNKFAIFIANYDYFIEKFEYESNTLLKILQKNSWNFLLQEGFILLIISAEPGYEKYEIFKKYVPKKI